VRPVERVGFATGVHILHREGPDGRDVKQRDAGVPS
jgi:hypothetical protein